MRSTSAAVRRGAALTPRNISPRQATDDNGRGRGQPLINVTPAPLDLPPARRARAPSHPPRSPETRPPPRTAGTPRPTPRRPPAPRTTAAPPPRARPAVASVG